ncbi:hypothetical protein, partial [Paucilactobacillus suebicus]
MLVLFYLIVCTLLAITVGLGLSAGTQKKVKTWLVVSRALYLFLLILVSIRFFYLVPVSPISATIKVVMTILFVLCIEIAYTKKGSTIFGTD